MPLSLHCGPFSYLEESFVSHLTANPPGVGRRVAVVTTSQRMGERLQRLLALERGLSFFNLRFHTLHSLSLDILSSSGTTVPVVNNDDLFHERLVERLLVEHGKMTPDRARSLAGAHRATVRDLVEAGVESDRFREHFGDMVIPGEEKLYRLLELADRYRDQLTSLNVAGSADLARLAGDIVETNPDALSGYEAFIYYGFYDLNGAQSDFFSAVARQAPVTLFFPCVKGQAGWAFAERFLELKLRVGGAQAQYGQPIDEGPLGNTLNGLFDPGRPMVPPAKNVDVVNVSGERDELWRVAKEILKLREGKNPPAWDEIGVVARGLDAYAGLIPEIFGDHGIPYAISDGGPLLSHPVARFAADLMDLPGSAHDRDALLDLISSPCLNPEMFPGTSLEESQKYLRESGPRAGLSHLLTQRGEIEPEIPEELRPPLPPRSLCDLAARLTRKIQLTGHFRPQGSTFFVKDPAGGGPVPTGESRLKTETEATSFSWTHHAARARARLESLVRRSSETDPVLDQLIGLLEQFSELDRFSPPVTEDEFSSSFVDALRRARRPGTGSVHGVRVLGAMEARGERFGVLFLVGLKEGVFPRVVREDPLLNDDLRRILRDPGGYWILPKREGYDEEKLLFTLLVSSVKEKLYLFYSRSGVDGRAEIPSLYLRGLARAAGISLEDAERLPRSPVEKWAAVSPSLLTVQEAVLTDLLGHRPVSGKYGEITSRAARLASGATLTGVDGVVGPPAAFLHQCATRGLSPSSLETLGNCPFEFFVSRVLHLRDPRPAYDAGGVRPFVLGQIQHAILHTVYRGFLSRPVPGPEEIVQQVRHETRRFFSALGENTAGPYPLLWSILSDRVENQLAAFVQRDVARLQADGYRPEKLEWALKAPMGGTPFYWTGRLDRVDRNPSTGRFMIIDYKNKIRKDPLLKRVLSGQIHQPPAYLELMEGQGVGGEGSVRYEYLASNASEELSDADWRAQRGAIEARRHELLSLVSAGQFMIHPTEGPNGHCQLCDFARACRKAHGPTRGGAFAPFSLKPLQGGAFAPFSLKTLPEGGAVS